MAKCTVRLADHFDDVPDVLHTFRVTMRVKGADDKLLYRQFTGTVAELQNLCEQIQADDNVITAGMEYLHSVDLKHVFQVFGIKAEDNLVEEVE